MRGHQGNGKANASIEFCVLLTLPYLPLPRPGQVTGSREVGAGVESFKVVVVGGVPQ